MPDAPQEPPPRKKSAVRRWTFRIVRILAAVYIGLCLLLAAFQTYLIFPGAATQGQRHAVVRATDGGELLNLSTPAGEKVVALFGGALTPTGQPRADAKDCPTILFFYGNGMC